MPESLPDSNEIDYLHPHGKPIAENGHSESAEEAKPTLKNQRIAEQEADGHYMPKDDPILHGDE